MPADDLTLAEPPAAGGAYRWIVCAIAWAAFTSSFIDRLAWGNLQLQVGHSFGLPLGALGVIVSAFYAGYVLSNAVTGFVSDRLGPRLVLSVCAVLLGAATAAFGFTSALLPALVLQVTMGLCAGADYAACVKLLTAWFAPNERGRAIGFWFTGSSLAVVLTNTFVPKLAASLGWQGAYHVLGIGTIGIGLICWLVLRDGPDRKAAVPRLDLMVLLRDRDILLVSLAGFGALWGTWGFAFWSNALMVRGQGLTPATAAGIVALFGLGAVIAKPVVGWLSDWLGGAHKLLAVICLFAFAAMLLVFGSLSTQTAFRIAAPFLGVTAFCYSPLMAALVAELAGRGTAGSASGVTNAFWQLGNLVVPIVVGLVFQHTGSYFAAFVTLACGPFLGAAVLMLVRQRREIADVQKA